MARVYSFSAERRHHPSQQSDRGQADSPKPRHNYAPTTNSAFDYRETHGYWCGIGASGLNFAIVDEVDSILIDEARTLIMPRGRAEDHTNCTCA